MGFEIPVDVDYFDHPKTIRLIAIIGEEADIYPLRLWKLAAKHYRDGVLGSSVEQIERALGWTGRGKWRGRLLEALVSCGFVDRQVLVSSPSGDAQVSVSSPSGDHQVTISSPLGDAQHVYIVHDWMQHIGRAILIYERKKQKQRDAYGKKVGILPEEFRNSSAYPGYPRNSGGDTPSAAPTDSPNLEFQDKPPVAQPELGPQDEAVRQLYQLSQRQAVIGKVDAIMTHLRGWIRQRGGSQRVEQVLMDPNVCGKDVYWINDNFFREKVDSRTIPRPDQTKDPDPNCQKCGGEGSFYSDVLGRKVSCSCIKRN